MSEGDNTAGSERTPDGPAGPDSPACSAPPAPAAATAGAGRTSERGVPVRARWAIAYRITTMLLTAALAAVAFTQHTQLWDIVGAVLVAYAIVDVLLLITVAWFRWRHRDELR